MSGFKITLISLLSGLAAALAAIAVPTRPLWLIPLVVGFITFIGVFIELHTKKIGSDQKLLIKNDDHIPSNLTINILNIFNSQKRLPLLLDLPLLNLLSKKSLSAQKPTHYRFKQKKSPVSLAIDKTIFYKIKKSPRCSIC